jgi:hypothetical protein
MKYAPIKSPDIDRNWKNELRLDALFAALGSENYLSIIETANQVYQSKLMQINLEDSIVKLNVFSNGQILESITL